MHLLYPQSIFVSHLLFHFLFLIWWYFLRKTFCLLCLNVNNIGILERTIFICLQRAGWSICPYWSALSDAADNGGWNS